MNWLASCFGVRPHYTPVAVREPPGWSLSYVPDAVLVRIYTFLDFPSLIHLAATSHRCLQATHAASLHGHYSRCLTQATHLAPQTSCALLQQASPIAALLALYASRAHAVKRHPRIKVLWVRINPAGAVEPIPHPGVSCGHPLVPRGVWGVVPNDVDAALELASVVVLQVAHSGVRVSEVPPGVKAQCGWNTRGLLAYETLDSSTELERQEASHDAELEPQMIDGLAFYQVPSWDLGYAVDCLLAFSILPLSYDSSSSSSVQPIDCAIS